MTGCGFLRIPILNTAGDHAKADTSKTEPETPPLHSEGGPASVASKRRHELPPYRLLAEWPTRQPLLQDFESRHQNAAPYVLVKRGLAPASGYLAFCAISFGSRAKMIVSNSIGLGISRFAS